MFRCQIILGWTYLLAATTTIVGSDAAAAANSDLVRGFSLTEIEGHLYDASMDEDHKTEAQIIVDKLYDLGVRQINLSPRATMTDPIGNELIPSTPPSDRGNERQRYSRLINYIHEKGMRVGIRPIFFVVDRAGHTPYVQILPDGTKKSWWHGNIQPQDPDKWFESYGTYLDIYETIAKMNRVEEFTIGAELYSMTVGIEDQWPAYPYGFPGPWLALLQHARNRLGAAARIMYDINFTDDKATSGGLDEYGGEFARWRYRLVDLANNSDPGQQVIWADLARFWRGLDAVGIDLYRSLASENAPLPSGFDALVALLSQTSDRYASQIDNALTEIQGAVGQPKNVILKEVGYRSVTRGFVTPFVYAGTGTLNLEHQAAAYAATLHSFWGMGWPWFKGIVFWDTSVDSSRHGPLDIGFSPIGKEPTEAVLREFFVDQ